MRVPSLASFGGLRIRHCRELWYRSQTQLRSCIAVAVCGVGQQLQVQFNPQPGNWSGTALNSKKKKKKKHIHLTLAQRGGQARGIKASTLHTVEKLYITYNQPSIYSVAPSVSAVVHPWFQATTGHVVLWLYCWKTRICVSVGARSSNSCCSKVNCLSNQVPTAGFIHLFLSMGL